jgi:hypothetical protein
MGKCHFSVLRSQLFSAFKSQLVALKLSSLGFLIVPLFGVLARPARGGHLFMKEKASQMASGIKRIQKDFTLVSKLAVVEQVDKPCWQ